MLTLSANLTIFGFSLKNMYKELQSDIEGFKVPQHGYLCGWAEQGKPLLKVLSILTNKIVNKTELQKHGDS